MSSHKPIPYSVPGPFRPDQVRSGDPYEISNGHPVLCLPTGADGAGPNGRGFMVLDSDPMAANAGVDPGMKLGALTMRAPDVGVGAFAERGGWIEGALPLAVEYAGKGQDEEKLVEKIEDLLSHGTKYVWVVRLIGPRRVEVHEKGCAMRTVLPGNTLSAPGVLQNAVPVEALYDREAAHEVTLANLLQRKGFQSFEDLVERSVEQGIEKGIEQGIDQGATATIEHQFSRRLGRSLSDTERTTLTSRIRTLGSKRLADVVIDNTSEALVAWLADSSAT
jgi:hypothetical protein